MNLAAFLRNIPVNVKQMCCIDNIRGDKPWVISSVLSKVFLLPDLMNPLPHQIDQLFEAGHPALMPL
jgi:hypothetical protein